MSWWSNLRSSQRREHLKIWGWAPKNSQPIFHWSKKGPWDQTQANQLAGTMCSHISQKVLFNADVESTHILQTIGSCFLLISWFPALFRKSCFFEKHNFYCNKDSMKSAFFYLRLHNLAHEVVFLAQKHDFLNISQKTVRSGVILTSNLL